MTVKVKRKNQKIRISTCSDKGLSDNPNFYTELSLKDSCKVIPKVLFSTIILLVMKLKREKKTKSKENEED
jgi:hypothetical protein